MPPIVVVCAAGDFVDGGRVVVSVRVRETGGEENEVGVLEI